MLGCSNEHCILSIWAGIWIAHFFDSVSIPQRVESMLSARVGRTNIGNHGSLAVSGQGILKHSGEHRLSKLYVILLLVKSPNAFLESQQTGIDISSLISSFLVVVSGVCASLRSREVNKAHTRMELVVLNSFQLHLQDGVGSRGAIISSSGPRRP